jgi:hypothetical protein
LNPKRRTLMSQISQINAETNRGPESLGRHDRRL